MAASDASKDSNTSIEEVEVKPATTEQELNEVMHHDDDLDVAAVKKIIRKVDLRLLPAVGLLYAVSLIDRVNLSSARIAGMDVDLQLSVGARYSIITMMLFVTYIIFDFPGNIFMRKYGPAMWLSFNCFAWGLVTIGTGFTESWGALLACRTVFGAFEGCIFPGCIFLLSCWYNRFEVQKRFGAFYCLGMLSSGFSSIIAYEIQKMKGIGGLNGWRWIFILEGILTCVVAVITCIALIDFPDKATRPSFFSRKPFLTTHEANILLARIQRDRGDALEEKLTFRTLLPHLADWKVWEMAMLLLCNNMVAYSFAYFLPVVLLNGIGFSLELTYELNFPPYVLAAIWMFVSAYIGDKFHIRGPIIAFNALVTITGVAMMGYLQSNVARYAGVFLGVASSNASIPAIFAYSHNNTVGQSKRAVATAIMVAFAGFGGIIASNVFRQQDAPQYLPGLNVVIGLQALTVIILCKNFWYFARQNRKADKGEVVIEGKEGFRFTY